MISSYCNKRIIIIRDIWRGEVEGKWDSSEAMRAYSRIDG